MRSFARAVIILFTAIAVLPAATGIVRTESVSPLNGSGASQVFTIVVSSTAGYLDIPQSHILISDTSSGINACWVTYGPGGGFGLAPDDPRGGWNRSFNSQCIIHQSASSVVGSGNNLTLTLSITFKANFSGKTLTLYSNADSASSYNYQPLTTFTVPLLPDFKVELSPSTQTVADVPAVFTVTVTPLNGFTGDVTLTATRGSLTHATVTLDRTLIQTSGTAKITLSSPFPDGGTFEVSGATPGITGVTRTAGGQLTINITPPTPPVVTQSVVGPTTSSGASAVFSLVVTGSTGHENIPTGYVLVNDSLSPANSCFMVLQRGSTGFSLAPDDPTRGWNSSENSQCIVNGSETTVTRSGNTVAIRLSLTFKPNYSGKTLTLYSNWNSAGNYNYQALASHTVPLLPDFRLDISPATQDAPSSGSAVYTVTVTPLNGFTGDVTLAATGPTALVTLSLDTTVIRGAGTATLTVTDKTPATPERSTVYVTGTANTGVTVTRSVSAAFTFEVPEQRPVVRTLSVSPMNGSGSSQVFTFVLSSSTGYQNLPYLTILLNDSVNRRDGCLLGFYPTLGGVYLSRDNPDDGVLGLWPRVSFGSPNSVENSQCIVHGTGSSGSGSGTDYTLTLSIAFKANFSGKTLTVYSSFDSASGFAYQPLTTFRVPPLPDFSLSISPPTQPYPGIEDTAQAHFTVTVTPINGFSSTVSLSVEGPPGISINPNVIQGGGTAIITVTGGRASGQIRVTGTGAGVSRTATATVTQPGVVLTPSFTPSNGDGTSQVFSFRFSHNYGYDRVANGNVLFAPAFDGRNSCWMFYDRPANRIWLASDDISTWNPLSLGFNANGTIQNSQCSITAVGASIVPSGNDVLLNLPVTFKPAFAGQKNVYMIVRDRNGGPSDYRAVGTWTVP